ncbi:hypothetical protein LWI29_019392 [Acer saccharum]|uniref:S1 motif domain-containing protein n=1 Tax=Acer saccharum TaxID=4024 RepID=A0AA39TGM1_ACESA|nr:hypothetical protein LWI29_019392 [Acer saccharum]
MPILTARIGGGSLTCLDQSSSLVYPFPNNHSISLKKFCQRSFTTTTTTTTTNAKLTTTTTATTTLVDDSSSFIRQSRRSADWKAARAYKDSGFIYQGRIEGFNGGVEPFTFLSRSSKSIHEVAKGLTGSLISVTIIQADEENKKLIFSEKEAAWTKYSERVNVGDIFAGRVGSIEDYGAFIHLRLPDGIYHLTGLVHVSEISWDLVQDISDVLNEGDDVRVKVIKVDRQRSRITLSIKQLEEDPLLETLDKVIPQDSSVGPDSSSTSISSNIEPLPGLAAIFEELLQEDGIDDVRVTRQGFEKRVVSQDLQLWLSNAPPTERKFTLLARAGRQVQEIQLTTLLNQEGIKKALQRVLERVP